MRVGLGWLLGKPLVLPGAVAATPGTSAASVPNVTAQTPRKGSSA